MLAAPKACELAGGMEVHETNPPCLANMTQEIFYDTGFKENFRCKSLNILARPERFELPTCAWRIHKSVVRIVLAVQSRQYWRA